MGVKLYVGNLVWDADDQDVADLFAANGYAVVKTTVVRDRDTGKSRGFAFVELATESEALEARAKLNGMEHKGRALRVDRAEPRR